MALAELSQPCVPLQRDDDLVNEYRNKKEWSTYKLRVSRSVRMDHTIKKTTFDMSLRKPVVLPDKKLRLWPKSLGEKIAVNAFP